MIGQLSCHPPLSLARTELQLSRDLYIISKILNLRTAVVSAFAASLAEHRAFWHALPTERLICARKIVSFVVRNDFSTPHRKELKPRKQ